MKNFKHPKFSRFLRALVASQDGLPLKTVASQTIFSKTIISHDSRILNIYSTESCLLNNFLPRQLLPKQFLAKTVASQTNLSHRKFLHLSAIKLTCCFLNKQHVICILVNAIGIPRLTLSYHVLICKIIFFMKLWL